MLVREAVSDRDQNRLGGYDCSSKAAEQLGVRHRQSVTVLRRRWIDDRSASIGNRLLAGLDPIGVSPALLNGAPVDRTVQLKQLQYPVETVYGALGRLRREIKVVVVGLRPEYSLHIAHESVDQRGALSVGGLLEEGVVVDGKDTHPPEVGGPGEQASNKLAVGLQRFRFPAPTARFPRQLTAPDQRLYEALARGLHCLLLEPFLSASHSDQL